MNLLHSAVINSDIKKMKELLSTPTVDVNATDTVGMTPLYHSVHSSPDCLKLLVNCSSLLLNASAASTDTSEYHR